MHEGAARLRDEKGDPAPYPGRRSRGLTMREIHREVVRRWRPYVQEAKALGLSWEEVQAIMKLVFTARPDGKGLCHIPVPANPIHEQLLRHLVGEVLEACGLPVLIMETRIPKE